MPSTTDVATAPAIINFSCFENFICFSILCKNYTQGQDPKSLSKQVKVQHYKLFSNRLLALSFYDIAPQQKVCSRYF
jgi:hypothetical protein